MIPAHRTPIVHCVKRSHLVHPHRRHLQPARNLVHNAQTRKAMLSLAEIKQGHDGGLFVLWRVPLQDLGDEGLIDAVEGEGDVGVVVGCIAVLRISIILC